MKTFLICSYPRSRTFWLANFFCVPGMVWCDHDATEFASTSAEFWANAELNAVAQKAEHYGDSDSGTTFVLPALLAAKPLTKVVWIERPLPEVRESMAKAGFPFTPEAEKILVSLKEGSREYFDCTLHYHDLGSVQAIKYLWDFLLPGQPFDYGRWGVLQSQRLAKDARHYQATPRGMGKFLNFIATEGEISWSAA